MASKKCPKCGEDNPAEAVMCWACYTPLSGPVAGGAAAATLGARGPIGANPVGVATAPREESASKSIDPKLIAGGAAALVLAGIAFAVMSMSGTSVDDGSGPGVDPTPSSDGGGRPPAPPPPNVTNGSLPAFGTGGSNAASVPPVALPFTTVTPPNPQFATGTVGILISADKVGQATGFARFAKDQLSRNGKWQNMQVAVFSDRQTADAFSSYQNKRRGAPLTNAEYQELAQRGVWATTPVFYESRGKAERIYKPSSAPYGWWPKR